VSWNGVAPAAWPFLTALWRGRQLRQPILVILADRKQQEVFHQDLETWLRLNLTPGAAAEADALAKALFFPAWEVLPHQSQLPHADVISERLECLVALSVPSSHGIAPVVVTNAVALTQKTFGPEELQRRLRPLTRGDTLDPLDLVEWLETQGYEPEVQVTQKGELALRGGIVDVFPLNSPWPVRLEFFGNELESLRWFDPTTQLSREEIPAVTIAPAGELGFLRPPAVVRETPGGGTGPAGGEGTGGAGVPPASPDATLLDYLPAGTRVFLGEPLALEERVRAHAAAVPAGDPFHADWDQLRAEFERRGLRVCAWQETPEAAEFEGLDAYRPLAVAAPQAEVAEPQRRAFFGQLHRWLRQGWSVHVFCNNDGERRRFGEVWAEYGLAAAAPAEDPGSSATVAPCLEVGALSRGFLWAAARLVVVTDAEIFGRYKVQRPRRLRSPHAAATRSLLDIDFAQLEAGDYVVHLQHGIGRYQGLGFLPGAGDAPAASAQECLIIEYAARDIGQPLPKLYVPITEAHLVSKYVGAGKARPPLNTLGGTRWAKAKAEATQAVRDLAAELLSVQAARAAQPGFAFPTDAPWQREFESAFLYEETPDQLRAITDTKRDLEAPKPMDRLICGDVGFGKTEVAIRAAFKAVLAGKQVAVLVPTTVLAQQHYNTFRERTADYPVRVELLSRFRTRRQQGQVVAALAAGAVDIVVGTHRLLQADVTFKDLGLVVVDEEQRFGVTHKERLKRMRALVDVLTLTATPIPRTLYLALTGARDLSTIETPPQDRLPVETLISPYDERLIRDAIQRELERGGQVFFLHNRVFDIEAVAHKLHQLVPGVRLAVGHGQMPADELEDVMTRFVNGDADVLLSTTIIESGIDIPNANTIIIDRADRFGLSDLYQLRGRVGRYKHQAYAYLLLPRHAGLLLEARKRISAIKQFSTPGSGFKIAMRDLELRGAGNLLGKEQSGHIAAVGFALYCQLLEQSVKSLKGEAPRPTPPVTLRLDFLEVGTSEPDPFTLRRPAGQPPAPSAPGLPKAAFPSSYVPEAQHRVELYRRLAPIRDRETLEAFQREVRDRFGAPPPAVELLFQVAALKLVAAERNVTAIETRADKVLLERGGDYVTIGDRFPRLTKRSPKARLNEIRRLLLAL
jgi:transcription-repair coupling factor (superfamily II helicase)